MSSQPTSAFAPFSLGVVAKNKPLGSPEIEVVPIETQNFVNGEITDHMRTLDIKGIDAQDVAYEESIVTTPSLMATWSQGESSNRITAPDVRRGDLVELYRLADDRKVYWRTLRNDFRKLETAIFAFSGTRDEDEIKPTIENSYYLEVSTHRKLITLSTSDKNGELVTYGIQLNPGEGNFIITDNVGNMIRIDSMEGKITHRATKEILLDAPLVRCTGNLQVDMNIHADLTIIDETGNTNHHSH